MNDVNVINHFYLNKDLFIEGSIYWNLTYGRLPEKAIKDEEDVATIKKLAKTYIGFGSHTQY